MDRKNENMSSSAASRAAAESPEASSHEGAESPEASSHEGAESPEASSHESRPERQRPKDANRPFEGPGENSVHSQQAVRLRRLVRGMVFMVLLGLIYYLWLTLTGIYIPCPVRLLTGRLCPGCGVTHCCLALAHLDFEAAYEANAFVFCLLPAAVPYGFYRAVSYVRRGERELSLGECIVFIFILIAAAVFTFIRNC